MIKKILLTIALIVMAFSIIGCQTVQGVGGDIKWTGQKSAEILEGK
jgi:predicted small secreted protein